MVESPRSTVRRWLVTAVHELGDQATRARVHGRIRELFSEEFTSSDTAPRVGRRGESAWQNNVDSLYDQLKHRGEMLPSNRGDPWRLQDSTRLEAQQLLEGRHSSKDADLLIGFKPKDSSEYVSRVQGQVLIKRRDHEVTLKLFGESVAENGWRPRTDVHPRDLEIERMEVVCLVEVKQVRQGNVTEAVREAVAQLLEYRHYLYRSRRNSPHLVAVFSEDIGGAHSHYLESLDIASVCKQFESNWTGNSLAWSWNLVPNHRFRCIGPTDK